VPHPPRDVQTDPARRALLLTGVGLAAAFARPAKAQSPPPRVDAVAAYRKMIAGADGGPAAWWAFGQMFAHVDGLREFAVAQLESVTLVQMEGAGDAPSLTWRQFGYFRDIVTGEVAGRWPNPFLGQGFPVPRSFRDGPDRYGLERSGEAAGKLTLAPAHARVINVALTAQAAEGRITVTQSETKVQAFPNADGSQPPFTAPGATGLQRVVSFVAEQAAVENPALSSVPASGFFSINYDSLPPWMGFGERYGATLVKGVLHKAGPGDRPNAAAWRRLKALHPDAFQGERLKTVWS
jgi:hypothetical protein